MHQNDPIDSPRQALIARLNELIEAERAGARVLQVFMTAYQADSAVHARLRNVQRDEAANCGVLIELVRHAGGVPSTVTGDFVAKALAIPDQRERLRFLNRGQAWVVRKIGEALPLADDAPSREALQRMLDSHVKNISACEGLLGGDSIETSLLRGYSSPPCSAHELDPNYRAV